jgi:hypothetical protein
MPANSTARSKLADRQAILFGGHSEQYAGLAPRLGKSLLVIDLKVVVECIW